MMRSGFYVSALLALLVGTQASAAGFEKNIMFGARWAGVAGAASAGAEGADSLYFNPAGLAVGVGNEITGEISPTWTSYEGVPFQTSGQKKSETGLQPISGVFYNYHIDDKLGLGVGVYTSGGSEVNYKDISVLTQTTDVKADIKVIEVALGAGYQATEEFRVGAAYRVGLVTGEFTTPAAVGTNVAVASLTDLKDEQFNGFKLGAQYTPSETMGLGLVIRTPLEFNLDGTLSAKNAATGAALPTSGTATAESSLPLAVALGGFYDFEPKVWRGYAEYVFTNYAANENLVINGTIAGVEVTDIPMHWKDMHNLRLAGEYMGTAWPIRFGYVYTSQVVPEEYARATFTAPGDGHTFTLGTGQGFMEDKLVFNTAVEYAWIKGDTGTTNTTGTYAGDYSTTAYALHLDLSYNF